MMCYSAEPRDRIFVKDYTFLSFSKSMRMKISKSFSGNYSQKPLDHAKQSATETLKTTRKKAVQKTPEATDCLIVYRIPNKIKKVSKMSPQIIQKYLEKDTYLQKKNRKLMI